MKYVRSNFGIWLICVYLVLLLLLPLSQPERKDKGVFLLHTLCKYRNTPRGSLTSAEALFDAERDATTTFPANRIVRRSKRGQRSMATQHPEDGLTLRVGKERMCT